MKAVVDSTPLIALSLIGRLSLLDEIFDEVIAPRSVFEEVTLFGKGRPGSKEVKSGDKPWGSDLEFGNLFCLLEGIRHPLKTSTLLSAIPLRRWNKTDQMNHNCQKDQRSGEM